MLLSDSKKKQISKKVYANICSNSLSKSLTCQSCCERNSKFSSRKCGEGRKIYLNYQGISILVLVYGVVKMNVQSNFFACHKSNIDEIRVALLRRHTSTSFIFKNSTCRPEGKYRADYY